jgi:hypothetical protein
VHRRHVLRSRFVMEKDEPRTVRALLTCAPITAVEWTSPPEKEREQPTYALPAKSKPCIRFAGRSVIPSDALPSGS